MIFRRRSGCWCRAEGASESLLRRQKVTRAVDISDPRRIRPVAAQERLRFCACRGVGGFELSNDTPAAHDAVALAPMLHTVEQVCEASRRFCRGHVGHAVRLSDTGANRRSRHCSRLRTTPANTSGLGARRYDGLTARPSAKLSREIRPVAHLAPRRRSNAMARTRWSSSAYRVRFGVVSVSKADVPNQPGDDSSGNAMARSSS